MKLGEVEPDFEAVFAVESAAPVRSDPVYGRKHNHCRCVVHAIKSKPILVDDQHPVFHDIVDRVEECAQPDA